MNANLQGIFLSLAGFAIYSTHDVFIKYLGVKNGLDQLMDVKKFVTLVAVYSGVLQIEMTISRMTLETGASYQFV